MDTQWWEWSGWTFIAVIAQILSLIAIVIALTEVMKNRRRVPPVVLDFEVFGTGDFNGSKYHACRMYNTGRSSAIFTTLSFFESRARESEGYKFRAVMGPGEHVDFLLTAVDIEKAFAFVIWRSNEDSTLAFCRWLPLVHQGSGGDLWLEAADRSKIRWWQRDVVRPVGPGYYMSARFRMSKSKAEKNMMKLIEGLGSRTGYPTSVSSANVPPNLPFVTF